MRVTHLINRQIAADSEKRLSYTLSLLEKYKKAKAIVTVRLHAKMPCLAFEYQFLVVVQGLCRGLFSKRSVIH